MTKEVELNISGIQKYDTHVDDDLKICAAGEYYCRGGSHYILYEERSEGFTETTKSMLKLKDGVLEMTRKGLINTNMIFDQSKETVSRYRTPFGEMHLGIHTKGLYVLETEELIKIEVSYTLKTEDAPMADCRILIQVKAKK